MRSKQEERMVFHFIKFKQDLLCYRNNSTELNQFIYKTIKFSKPWKCINKCTNGNKQSK